MKTISVILIVISLMTSVFSIPEEQGSYGSDGTNSASPSVPQRRQTTPRTVVQRPANGQGQVGGYQGQVGSGYPGGQSQIQRTNNQQSYAQPGGGYQGQVGSGYPGGQGQIQRTYNQQSYAQPGQTQGGYQGGNAQGGYPQGGYQQGGYPQGGYQQGGYPQGGYQQAGGQGGYRPPAPQQEKNPIQSAIEDSIKQAGANFVKGQVDKLIYGDRNAQAPAGGQQGGYRQGGYQGGYQQGGYQQGGYPQGGYQAAPNNRNPQGGASSPVQDAFSDSLKKAGSVFLQESVSKLLSGNSQPAQGSRY